MNVWDHVPEVSGESQKPEARDSIQAVNGVQKIYACHQRPQFSPSGPRQTSFLGPVLVTPLLGDSAARWGGRGWTTPSLCPFEPKQISTNIHSPGKACLSVLLGVVQHGMTKPVVAWNGVRFLKLGPQAPFILGLRLFLGKEICQKKIVPDLGRETILLP